MIDLDAVQARYDAWSDPSPADGELDDIAIETRTWKSARDVPALLAELRVARELAKDLAAQDPETFDEQGAAYCRFCATRSYKRAELAHDGQCIWLHAQRLTAYDKLTEEHADG